MTTGKTIALTRRTCVGKVMSLLLNMLSRFVITSRQIYRGYNGNSDRLYFLGSKITADGDCSHELKRHLLLGRKAMTNLDSILKSRDITLRIKVHLVKAMDFPIIMYGCEKVKAKVVQSCPTLCKPMDYTVHGILQARILEWEVFHFSRGSSQPRD